MSSKDDREKGIYFWRISDGKLTDTPMKDVEFAGAVFHPNGKLLATDDYDGKISIWRITDGKLMRTIDDHCQNYEMAFSPDGRLLALRSRCIDDDSIRFLTKLWNVQTGKLDSSWQVDEGTYVMHPPAFSPDGTRVVYGSLGELYFRRISDGFIERKLKAHRPIWPESVSALRPSVLTERSSLPGGRMAL